MGRRGHRMPALRTVGVFLSELSQRCMEMPSGAQRNMAEMGEKVSTCNRGGGTNSSTRTLAVRLWRTSQPSTTEETDFLHVI